MATPESLYSQARKTTEECMTDAVSFIAKLFSAPEGSIKHLALCKQLVPVYMQTRMNDFELSMRVCHSDDFSLAEKPTEMKDGRPFSTDTFLAILFTVYSDASEREEAITAWLKGDWENACMGFDQVDGV